MLTLTEQYALRELAEDFIYQVQQAIMFKEVRRRSRNPRRGIFYAKVNASGELFESIRPEFSDNGIEVLCLTYIDSLIYGVKPGESDATVTDIERWMDDKGLNYNASNIVYNLKKYGSSIWEEHMGADSGLFEDVDITTAVQRLKDQLNAAYAEQVASEIYNSLAA